jgi:hypothetical protein
MPEPVIAHTEAIHLANAAGASLSGSNKLDETSKVTISTAATLTERMNLNSNGYTNVTATWKSLSGSMDYRVMRESTVQELIVAGGTAYLTRIIDAAAASGETKGYEYKIVFESVEENYEAGSLLGGTASFKVDGAPTTLLGT